ncbi:DNA repair and recombination protein RAD26, putative [Pediculus humanus corporis]|uniref:DNA repair and recombination protein RAD54-like n=1 Tax=Pediculus humanus subsp. corporis TaxID=121224 RepID=E0VIU5_PEDHC|nr:DNA repair and recombination protein RAD26, putative [Pediculus humanus corporis]EEB13301.1 DNA repair and recombination protein RAD26, putative [Pediculus humanus corporis]
MSASEKSDEENAAKNNLQNSDTFTNAETFLNGKFTVDRTSIPTVLENGQLSSLGIKVYQQEVLEEGILHQVDKALEILTKKNDKENVTCQKHKNQEENKSENDNENNAKHNSLLLTAPEETEKEKKIRMGEMTPFGTEVSIKKIEGNNLERIEEYIAKQRLKGTNEKKGVKRKHNLISKEKNNTNQKSKLIKNTNILKKSNNFSLEKNESDDENQLVRNSIKETNNENFKKRKNDYSSGSEYIPSDSNSSDLDFELKSVTKNKKQIKKSKIAKEESEIDNDYVDTKSSKEKKQKIEKDDGDEISYLQRIEDWESENKREEYETQLQTIDNGFKMPSIIWNKLFKYQRVGVQWLWELNIQQCGGILGDEMGLGKTIQIIAFLAGLSVSKLLSRHGYFRGLGPVLIVCPTTVMHQWVREFHKWWPQFRVALLHESGTYHGKKYDLIKNIIKSNGILITSYITCLQQSSDLQRQKWHYVILDEGHKIRNPDSQIAINIKLLNTPHRLILSGSPIQNNLKELWSLFDFIFPGKLGTLPVFLAEFGVPITQGGYANASKVQVLTAYKCATVLRDTISPYLLRRAKEDVKTHINLPPKNEQVLFCRLTNEQKELYVNYLNSGSVNEIFNGKQKLFVGLINLRKICNHPHLYSGGPKHVKLDDLEFIPEENKFGYWKKAGKMIVMETLLKIWKKQGHRVLIFTQSRKMLSILENFVLSQNYEYLKLDGTTNIGSRQPLINKFNEEKKYYIFLSTTHVGGLGVNLTGANRVVIYDPDWNPATDMQARERAWRIGQENQVTIYRLVTSGTIEEKIYHRQIFKQFLTNKVLKDPSQRRFFKSNDLYELFTYKDDEYSNETSAIFAGTNFELNLKNIQLRKKKEKSKKNLSSIEPESVQNAVEAQKILTKEKIEKMKQMAQILSRQIALNSSSKDKNPENPGDPTHRTNNDSITDVENLKLVNNREKKRDKKKGKKKEKKKDSNDAYFDGEFIPHLKKKKNYRDVIKNAYNFEKDDDYILKKLFSKSGVQSALKHDQIMGENSSDYALVEGEAEKVAKEAVKALKESRRQYVLSFNETSSSISHKARFGKKSFRRRPGSGNTDENKRHFLSQEKIMTSSELLQRIRQRNGMSSSASDSSSSSSLDENSELLADIRNFISFGAEVENKASTQEIVDKFKDRLPSGQTPLFKALLNEICEFHRGSNGEGIWELRQDFQW